MILATILGRRSIRRYSDMKVADLDLDRLLRAAMAAPSAGNQQPWHFVVIRERALLDAIPPIHPNAGMARNAPLAILVCGDVAGRRYPEFWVQDCSAATENLLLAAHSRGLGAVWCGIYPDLERATAFRTLLGIPEQIIPMALVVVGHPAESKPPADRYDPERVHWDGWAQAG